MSKYTTELRFICESICDNTINKDNVEDVINNTWNKIFNFNFDIFDENYREVICKKIIKHYYTQEIGFETVGLWKLKLNMRMNEIMPYYNKLYMVWKDDFDPLNDTNITTKHSLNKEIKNNSTKDIVEDIAGQSQNNSQNAYSDTPQGSLQNVENMAYLTNARIINDIGSGSSNRTNNETGTNNQDYSDNYIETIIGKRNNNSYSATLQEYKNALINIDMLVIGELQNLFMLIW